jgi:tetratricopeptide (TPR) repeat protein
LERPKSNLSAYDLYLRALSHYERGRGGVQRALELLGQAIERDPGYGPALGLAAHCHQVLDIIGCAQDRAANRSECVDLARRALVAAKDDPDVLGRVAFAFGYFGEDLDAAIALIDRARGLNPNFALGWFRSAWLRLWHGEPDVAIKHFQTALRLSFRNPDAACFLGIGVGHIFNRRFEEARAMLLRSLQESPNSVPTYRWLALCYTQMGRLDEARQIIDRLWGMVPMEGGRPLALEIWPEYRNPEHHALYLSGLRMAHRGENNA